MTSMTITSSSLVVFVLLHSAAHLAEADKCGGNCPSNGHSADRDCLCGTAKKVVDIANWCAKFKFWNQKCCQCVVAKESEGNANAVHRSSGGSGSNYNVGLWQINSVNWALCNAVDGAGKAPCDPQANLNCAIKVYQWAGNSWQPWSTAARCPACN